MTRNPRPAKSGKTGPLFQRIYDRVRLIPEGKVATYGQIGAQVGGISGRLVGFALAGLSARESQDVPWQRVINARGCLSLHGMGALVQRALLEDEGVTFQPDESVDLSTYGWGG